MLSFSPTNARYDAAMKDSWSRGDDRRERGRVDRGITRSRRSRSPFQRREGERDSEGRGREIREPRPISDRPHERSQDRRRRLSRSPIKDSREDVRERNRGRELLESRGSGKPKRNTHHSPSSSKRRKSRSPSPPRSHHKRSRRVPSRSPPRGEEGSRTSSRPDKKHRALSPLPHRRRSPERKSSDIRGDRRNKHRRDSGLLERRGRSTSPKRERRDSQQGSTIVYDIDSKHSRSPQQSPGRLLESRARSPPKGPDKERAQSPINGRNSPEFKRYEYSNRSRQPSPRAPRGSKPSRGSSPKRDKGGRSSRDEYRPGKPLGKAKGKSGRQGPAASGANSIEVKGDKMANRGFYGSHQGYNPNQQMQAAFPLKPQYQGGQLDLRQYSQSPQHQATPNSYHSSPQAQSPYGAGRGNWNSQQPQQYSPQP